MNGLAIFPPINRSDSVIRDYSDLDVRQVEFIKRMWTSGLPIEVLIEYFGSVQQGDQTMAVRKEILNQQRIELTSRMSELQKTTDLLNYKISDTKTRWQKKSRN